MKNLILRKTTKNKLFLFTKILIGLFWLLWTLGHLQGIVISPNIRIYGHDLVVISIIFLQIIAHAQSVRAHLTHIFKKILYKNIKIFFLSFLILIWGGYNSSWISILYFLRIFAYSIFIWMQIYIWRKNPKTLTYLVTTAGSLMIILGILQFFILPDLRQLYILGWDDHYYRISSTILDPNFFAVISLWSMIGWMNIFKNDSSLTKYVSTKNLKLMVLSVGLSALILSFSRASYLAGFVSLSWWFKDRLKSGKTSKNKSIFASIIITKTRDIRTIYWGFVLGFVLIALTLLNHSISKGGEGVNLARTASIWARTETTLKSVEKLKEDKRIIFGYGFLGVINPNSDKIVPQHSILAEQQLILHNNAKLPDNVLIFILTNFGVVGISIITIIAFSQKDKINSWWRDLTTSQKMLLITLIVHSLFNNTILEPFCFLFFWSLFFSQKLQLKADKHRS